MFHCSCCSIWLLALLQLAYFLVWHHFLSCASSMTEENNDRLNFREEYHKVCEGKLDNSSNFCEKIASLAEEMYVRGFL